MSLTYTLRHRPTGTEEWTEVTGITDTTYELTGLSPGVRYDVEVTAVSSSGASSTAMVTQRSTRCAPPTHSLARKTVLDPPSPSRPRIS